VSTPMRRTHTILTVLLGLALVLSLVVSRKTQRELQQQLHTVTDANGVLRETLGNLTVAITQKDEEIDRLHSSCSTQDQGRSDSRPIPPSRKGAPAKPPLHIDRRQGPDRWPKDRSVMAKRYSTPGPNDTSLVSER
jgi:hypothetical protein